MTYQRIWEIDFVRGIAIILMIIFHFIVDLKDFYSYPLDYLNGFWYLEGKLSAILFILLCGVSATLGKNSTRHGITIFIWAMVLTVITYLYNENNYIRFGILHFLGISLLSVHFIRQLPSYWLMILSLAILVIGNTIFNQYITNPYLFPIGLKSYTFVSMDYYPLFPWYGVFLVGIMFGQVFYGNKRSFSASQLCSFPPFKLITYLGKHSLPIYLVHQPILLFLLYLFLEK